PSNRLSRCRARRRGSGRIHDESGTPLAGYISPNPLQKDTQAETRCSQELEVNESPNQPRPQSARLDLAALQYGKTPAHHRHVALVEVAKGSRLPAAGYAAVDQCSCIPPLLHSNLRYTGKGLAVLLACRGIADHKDFGMSGHSKIFFNAHPPAAVRLHV